MKPKLNNRYYCLTCNKSYQERPTDIESSLCNEYCRYLGYCSEECIDKQSPYVFNHIVAHTYCNGDKVKRTHKYYMENIKGFNQK